MKTFLFIVALLNVTLIALAVEPNRRPDANFEGAAGYVDILVIGGCVLIDVFAVAVYFIAKLF